MIFYIPLFLSFAATKIVYYKPVCKIEMKNPKPWEEYILWENRYERSPVIAVSYTHLTLPTICSV